MPLSASPPRANSEQQEVAVGQQQGMEAKKNCGCVSHLSLQNHKRPQSAVTNAAGGLFPLSAMPTDSRGCKLG